MSHFYDPLIGFSQTAQIRSSSQFVMRDEVCVMYWFAIWLKGNNDLFHSHTNYSPSPIHSSVSQSTCCVPPHLVQLNLLNHPTSSFVAFLFFVNNEVNPGSPHSREV